MSTSETRKCWLAWCGMVVGIAAFAYCVFSYSHAFARLGLSVQAQVVAIRVMTVLVFVAFALMLFAANWLWGRVPTGVKNSRALKWTRVVLVVVVPLFLAIVTLKTPFWSKIPPSHWDRPMFMYGWPIPCKSEWGNRYPSWLLSFSWLLWTFYLMCLLGCRKVKSYLVANGVIAAISLLLRFPWHRL